MLQTLEAERPERRRSTAFLNHEVNKGRVQNLTPDVFAILRGPSPFSILHAGIEAKRMPFFLEGTAKAGELRPPC